MSDNQLGIELRSSWKTLVWELWRTSRADLATRLPSALSFALLLYAVGRLAIQGPESLVIQGIMILTMVFAATASKSWLSRLAPSQAGFDLEWHFAQPLRTRTLVLIPLGYSLLTSAIVFLVPAIVIRWLSGWELALLWPLAVVMCLSVCLFAATHISPHMLARFLAVATVFAGVVGLIMIEARGHTEPWLMQLGRSPSNLLDWRYAVGMFGVVVVACWLACVGVARQRCGESLGGVLFHKLVNTRQERGGRSKTAGADRRWSLGGRYESPVWAQFWYEYANYGRRTLWLSCMVPVGTLVLIGFALLMGYDPAGADRTWMLVLLLAPISYQIIGIDGALGLRNVGGTIRMSAFDAARPLSNVRLIEIKLLMIAGTSILGWLILAVSAAAYVGLFGQPRVWSDAAGQLAEAWQTSPVALTIAVLSSVGFAITCSSSQLLAGFLWLPRHPWASGLLSILLVLHLSLFLWDSSHGYPLLPLWRAYGYLVPAAGMGYCLWILWQAYQAGMFRTRLFAVGCLVTAALASSGLWLLLQNNLLAGIDATHQMYLVLIAMMLAPLAAVASAPLALAAHRHQ